MKIHAGPVGDVIAASRTRSSRRTARRRIPIRTRCSLYLSTTKGSLTIGAGSLPIWKDHNFPRDTKLAFEKWGTMKAMTNAEFAARVAELAKGAGPPQATDVYDPDGDCIEFLAKPEPF